MKALLKEHKKYKDIEMPDECRKKLIGNSFTPGCSVRIFWNGDDESVDNGYAFSLPICVDEYEDFFVHIPKPDNSAGIGDAPPVWIHINALLMNEQCNRVFLETLTTT